jgi:uncharacterized protein (DUF2164 family)
MAKGPEKHLSDERSGQNLFWRGIHPQTTMPTELDKHETQEVLASLRRYCAEELEMEISEMRAKLFLDYILKEIAPFAYNQGVKDSDAYFRRAIEDLSGTCFEEKLTYWKKKKK